MAGGRVIGDDGGVCRLPCLTWLELLVKSDLSCCGEIRRGEMGSGANGEVTVLL